MNTGRHKEVRTDYIFARYPLWVRYSGLPVKIGPGPWCIFQRLLELMERFGNSKFHYSIERLGGTAGVSSQYGVKKILDKLSEEGLIRYKTHHGRGQKTEFEVVVPLRTPVSEEDVYRDHPRLRSRSYLKKLGNKNPEENPNKVVVSEEENPNKVVVSEEENPNKVVVSEEENPNKVVVLRNNVGVLGEIEVPDSATAEPKFEGQKKPPDKDKNDLFYKKDNNNKNDLSHEKNTVSSKEQISSNPNNDNAVVAPNTQNLKEYGISGELAERYTRTYAPHYIEDKIEIIEYKRFKGEQIRNPGGMLKKAIEEDWQRPEGFSTRAQREKAARAAKEAEKAEKLKEKERLENIRREEETAAAAEKWRKAAAPEILATIRERAVKEVKARFPDTDESLLRVPIRLEENRIIAKEFLSPDSS